MADSATKDLTGTDGNASGGRGLPDVGSTMGSVTNPTGPKSKNKKKKGKGNSEEDEEDDEGFGLDNGKDVKGSLKVHIKLDLEADIRIIARVKGDIAIGIFSIKTNRNGATPDTASESENEASLATITVSKKQKIENYPASKPAQEEEGASEEDNTPFHFMNLSGELRNFIYELAAQSEPYGRVIRLEEADVSFGAPDLQRQYLGLTQVNRAVRNEFLPLYTQTYKHEILFADLPAYLASYPLEDVNLMQTMIKLVVGLRDHTLEPPGLDIKSLVALDWHELPFQVAFAHNSSVHGLSSANCRLVVIEKFFHTIVHSRMATGSSVNTSSNQRSFNQDISTLLQVLESCRIEKKDAQPDRSIVTFVVSREIHTCIYIGFAVELFFLHVFGNTPPEMEFRLRFRQH
ncbi:hypothetical protein PTMSG1_06014 [Pyrenophora teres f. maculata]|nr:hypothetical protein PTMSG1_06014 [Pyrenophora teres f. maculata]